MDARSNKEKPHHLEHITCVLWVKMFKSTEFSINQSVIVSPAGRLWTYIHHIHLHPVTWNIKSFFMRHWWYFIPRRELDTLSEATVADIKKRANNKKNLVTPRKRQQKFFTHERRIIPPPIEEKKRCTALCSSSPDICRFLIRIISLFSDAAWSHFCPNCCYLHSKGLRLFIDIFPLADLSVCCR